MGEDGAQAERSGGCVSPSSDAAAAAAAPVDPGSSPSPVPSGSRSPSLQPSAPGEPLRDGAQVNAITVLTLLDKLVNMLDAVQEKQQRMERRQIELEGSVKGIQGDLGKLCKSHASTGNAVAKLLEKSRKVSAHTRDVRDRMDRQCAQVKRLEHNHAQLLRRNHFKVLIFQEENEIPASVFVKEPVPSITDGKEEPVDENKTLEETLHTVELSSEDETPHDEGADDSMDEKIEETRAEKIKRSSLKKVDSLKKAFSRQNIEKKMNKLGTKIVSVERREKIKKSLTPNHQKSPASKSSSFKVSPLTFNVKKVRDGDTSMETEDKLGEAASSEHTANDEETSFTEIHSDPASPAEEGKALADSLEKETGSEGEPVVNDNIELAIVEDDDNYGATLEVRQEYYDEMKRMTHGEMEQSDEEPSQAAVRHVDQTA